MNLLRPTPTTASSH